VANFARFTPKPVRRPPMAQPRPSSVVQQQAAKPKSTPLGTQTGNDYGKDGTGFNKFAAGIKRYGLAGASAPTQGRVDRTGYAERDAKSEARKAALQRRIQKGQI